MREALGEPYVSALRAGNADVEHSVDFVMYWWDHAAKLLTAKGSVLRRFGLVTTNSIDHFFNRRLVARYLEGLRPISLTYAIPDHPWTKATKDAAVVRIAMTVASAGMTVGRLLAIEHESRLDSDAPTIAFGQAEGFISANLTIGARLSDAKPLRANAKLASMGPALGGRGFVLQPSQVGHFQGIAGADASIIRPLVTGKDITERDRARFVIDLRSFSSEAELRARVPSIYDYLLETVRPVRAKNNDPKLRDEWWRFRRSNEDFASMTQDLGTYIATVETTKHRVFVLVRGVALVEHGVVGFGTDDPMILGYLSSHLHVCWTLAQGGTLEDRPRYNKILCFDPFPFPDPVPETLKQELREAAEELDSTRKAVLEAHPDLTLTKLYNVLEKVRATARQLPVALTPNPSPQGGGEQGAGNGLTEAEIDIRDRGRVLILKDLHDTIDRLTFRAYGWPETLSDEEILERLVALNKERRAEEARGQVRWLRPEYQIPRFGAPAEKKAQIEAELVAPEDKAKPGFPKDETRRAMAISGVLAGAGGPLSVADVATHFRQGKKLEREIGLTLRAFVRLGYVSSEDGGKSFLLRRIA